MKKLLLLFLAICTSALAQDAVKVSSPSPNVEHGQIAFARGEPRWIGGPKLVAVPFELDGLQAFVFGKVRPEKFTLTVGSRINAYLVVPKGVEFELPKRWTRTTIEVGWGEGRTDAVYAREFLPGRVEVPLLPALDTPVALVLEHME